MFIVVRRVYKVRQKGIYALFGVSMYMANIFIIHSAYGTPEENWIPWLKNKLEEMGQNVFVPRFPTPENQNLDAWMKVFDAYRQYLGSDSILVGHSIGVAFILNVLEGLDRPVKAAFLVSGFKALIGIPEFDEINRTFVERRLDWNKIRKNCEKFIMFHSDNDPYVPLANAEEVAKNLGIKIILVKGAGHFNQKAGYTSFDLLFEKMKEEI